MTSREEFSARMRIGAQGSTPPELLYTFTMIQVGDDTRVQALVRVESSTIFGQKRGFEVEDTAAFNDVESTLIAVGGEAPAAHP